MKIFYSSRTALGRGSGKQWPPTAWVRQPLYKDSDEHQWSDDSNHPPVTQSTELQADWQTPVPERQ